jgi:hypothetical protein
MSVTTEPLGDSGFMVDATLRLEIIFIATRRLLARKSGAKTETGPSSGYGVSGIKL